jgi:hypothetical protein
MRMFIKMFHNLEQSPDLAHLLAMKTDAVSAQGTLYSHREKALSLRYTGWPPLSRDHGKPATPAGIGPRSVNRDALGRMHDVGST